MTFLATSQEFLKHDVPGHPETAERLRSILAHAKTSPTLAAMERLEPDRPAHDEELLRVHTPRVLLAVRHAEASSPAWLDPDTYVVAGTDRVARLAARLTLQAAERALRHNESGLVMVRPPGHHATRDRSMGFCLYNNVAVAAQHVLDADPQRRVLIFDHDVHHGNGTQDAFWTSSRVLYQSFHLSPHYPGTGLVTDIGHGDGEGFTMNLPLPAGAGDAEVRAGLEHVFLPTARAFRPDLVLVSAGFDSLEGDPLGGLTLSPPFLGEIVHRLGEVCPRVVGVLEGGYQVDAIPRAVEAQAKALEGGRYPTGSQVRPPPMLEPLLVQLSAKWPVLARP